ncbi:hypothetical protein CYY_002725 [Polysphondylium violaceum]|uniref:Transmembrane protein n=1 Tax=Polysphondylium violaceum TaxID=133409 RepID=A0A8J4Q175_9MYCE|nr:hypothetical protein CYY_002725 [Polysphondylium violaceum]
MVGSKLTLSLIVGLIFVLTVKAALYVQMTPYSDQNCKNQQYGVGFSFLVGQCMGVGDNGVGATNIKVKVDGSHSNVTISEYGNYDTQCGTYNPNLDVSYEVGGCYRAPSYSDGSNNFIKYANFVYVTIEENPNIPIYGYRNSWYADSKCISNPQWFFFFTNNTSFKYGDDAYLTYSCLDAERMYFYIIN